MNLRIQLVWNREFDWMYWGDIKNDLESIIKTAESLRDGGDGASVKKIRVVDVDNEVALWPEYEKGKKVC